MFDKSQFLKDAVTGAGRKIKDGNGYKVVDFVILESAWQAFGSK